MTRSSVEPSTNSPGWRMNGSSPSISRSSVSPSCGCLTSMYGYRALWNTRNVAVDAHVDARRLEQRGVIRVDPDAAVGDERGDGAVGKDHAAILPSARRRGRRVPSGTPPAPSSVKRGERLLERPRPRRRASRAPPSRSPARGPTTVRRRSAGSSRAVISPCSSSSPRASRRRAATGRARARARRPSARPRRPPGRGAPTWRRPSDAPSTSSSSSGVGRRRAQRPRITRRSWSRELRHPVPDSLPSR